VSKRMQQSPHIQLRDMKVHRLTSIVLQAQSHDRAPPRIGGTRNADWKRDADLAVHALHSRQVNAPQGS
jgi:hypothetical protein